MHPLSVERLSKRKINHRVQACILLDIPTKPNTLNLVCLVGNVLILVKILD